MTSTGRRREAMAFSTSIPSTASRNPRRMRKGLPAISTEASPSLAMVSRSFGPKSAQDMLKVGRRTDRRYRRNIRHVGRGYDRSGATQAVPDKEGR